MIAIAHQTAAFSRQTRLQSLDYYLLPAKPVIDQKKATRDLVKMFKNLQAKGAPVKVERIVRERKQD